MRNTLIIVLLIICTVPLLAQQNGGFGNSNQRQDDFSTPSNDSLIIGIQDTLSNDVFAYSLDYLTERILINDTLLHNMEEYEMTREVNERMITLGNPGSAATGMLWNQQYYDGFHLGFNQHKPYKIQEEDLRFYKIEKPYSHVYFAPGSSQASFRTKALLVRDFRNDVQVSLNYDRINSQPVYSKSTTRHTSFHLGMYQKIDSSRWAYSVNFRSNSNFEQLNGGITKDSLLYVTGNQIRSLVPVTLDDVSTYQLSRDYSARAYYFLQDKPNSKQYLQLKLNHDRGLYKFTNTNITTIDTTFFTEEFIPSELGMRMPINLNKSTLRLSYHLENKLIRSHYWGKYALNQVKTDQTNQNISELVAGAENSFEWRGFQVNLDGYFGTVNNRVLLDLQPQMGFDYKGKAAIKFGLRIHTEPSSYKFNRMEITFKEIYNQDPFTLTSQEIYGKVQVPLIGLFASVKTYAGQNIPVLSNANGLDFELRDLGFLEVDIEEKIKYGWFNFNNRFVTQIRSGQEKYDMPAWYTRHEIFFEGKLFGSLNFQSGVNVDLVPSYSLPAYSPLLGEYYSSDSEVREFFYRLDPYASIRVQGFRFFVKYENLAGLWENNVIYEAELYPQFDNRLRLGVSWELRN